MIEPSPLICCPITGNTRFPFEVCPECFEADHLPVERTVVDWLLVVGGAPTVDHLPRSFPSVWAFIDDG